jgi:molecular chaperone DnaK (HSP70)
MQVLGIDFGTVTTVAMLRTPDRPIHPLLFDGHPLLPSAVHVGADGRPLAGRTAAQHTRADPGRGEAHLKRHVDDGALLLGDVQVPVPRLIATVLGVVGAEARRELGGPPDEIRLTCPAHWPVRRRAVLADAATLAGLTRPQLVPDPIAAAAYCVGALGAAIPLGAPLAVYDLGAGSCDTAVVRRTDLSFEVVAAESVPDGGALALDTALIDHLRTRYPVGDPAALMDDVRAAREQLSQSPRVTVAVPGVGGGVPLVREEFEELIGPHLDRGVGCLAATVEVAGLTPADLAAVVLVGGASRIPLVARLIHRRLGIAPKRLDRPETVVAEGSLRIDTLPAPPRRPEPSRPPRVEHPPMPPREAEILPPKPPPRTTPPPPRPPRREPALLLALITGVLMLAGFVTLFVLTLANRA